MTRAALVFLVLFSTMLLGRSRAEAQLQIGPSIASMADFLAWTGTGFDPLPGTGRLDSDEWRPFGTGVPAVPFGGTCTSGICARGIASSTTATTGGPGFYAIVPASPFPLTTVLAMHASDTGLNPGGIVLRLVNADLSATIRRATVQVQWAQRLGIATSADTLLITADDCGSPPTSYPITLDTDALGTIHGTGPASWQTHDASLTLDTSAAPLMPGDNACIVFTIGTIGGLRDVIALGRVSISVPASTCGDGVVDPVTEECEPSATPTPCGCDMTCHFPTGACADGDGNPCTSGMCVAGNCHATPITASNYVPACDHDGNPCTFEGCIAGSCAQLAQCMPASTCFTCDPTLLSCAVPVSGMVGCCTSDDDCSTTCVIGMCNAGTCTTRPDPGCGDSGAHDGGAAPIDAGIDAGSSERDAGRAQSDADSLDGGSITITPGNHFGGGGGCRCRAGGTNDGRSSAWAGIVLAMMFAQRGRRRR